MRQVLLRFNLSTLLFLTFTSLAVHAAEAARHGELLSAEPNRSVDDCIQNHKQLQGKSIKVQGEVSSVCQKKGCWFVLKGANGQDIRITSKGYKFFVAKDSAGMIATVEGKFEKKKLSKKLAQHYEDDRVAGTQQAASKIEGPQYEYTIAATAVEIQPRH